MTSRPGPARGAGPVVALVDLAAPRFGRNDTIADHECEEPAGSDYRRAGQRKEPLCARFGCPQRHSEPSEGVRARGMYSAAFCGGSSGPERGRARSGEAGSVTSLGEPRTTQIPLPFPLPLRRVIRGYLGQFRGFRSVTGSPGDSYKWRDLRW